VSALIAWLLAPERWPALRLGLHLAFLLLMLALLWRIYRLAPQCTLQHLGKPRAQSRARWALLGLALGFGAVLAHQASWQLTGMLRPRFVAFMQLYDRRDFNPAHGILRGAILDRRGEPLAYSEEILGKVYRLYPEGPTFAPVLGYAHPRFGASGLEAVARAYLNGGAPAHLGDWGRLGRQVVTQERRPRGPDLALTLDAELQRLAVAELGERTGAVVAIRPQDGAVLVLASTPSFDPNRLDAALFERRDPRAPLLNRATQGLYPPGSTFKVAMAGLALEAGFGATLECPAEGYTTAAHYPRIRDHEYYEARRAGRHWAGHGRLGLGEALALSSNSFFAQLGVGLGHARLEALTERLAFGQSLVLHQSAHGRFAMRTGELPRLAHSDRYGLAQVAVGQGRVLLSPAYLALFGAAIANHGLAMRPHLISGTPSAPLAPFFSPEVSARLLPMLRAVVREGTARSIETPALAIAGKTGTAEHGRGPSHAWFLGLAPAERPRLAVAVLVEEGGYGSTAAAPIAQRLLLRAQALGLLE